MSSVWFFDNVASYLEVWEILKFPQLEVAIIFAFYENLPGLTLPKTFFAADKAYKDWLAFWSFISEWLLSATLFDFSDKRLKNLLG